ncbi:ABC transporter substrate-binding protein [Halalkalicoccus subterraneus]|uniref:ABC transporter substrate-binding protein n=1 Tax=Halalkalicoccus subterraneus TaxID=2675002 RepID=UPI000EFB0182|nr:ABC transporter substrate-binding protein [Halalkalicoccus subterraneus]
MAGDGGMTRRQYLTYGGAVAGGGALAGCIGGSNAGNGGGSGGNETESGSDRNAESEGPYTVSMEPVGEVEFDAPPGTWVANNGSWADMGVALGYEPPQALWLTDRYHTQYYDEIPDVSVDTSGMTDLYQDGVDKELFYELDADVHVIDPNFLLNRYSGWEQADIDEIHGSVGPFFGNSVFSREYDWHDDYQYYTLYEAFEKLSQAFQEQERYEQFATLHEEFQGRVEEVVPPEENRPEVAVLWADGDAPETFLPYVISEGTSFKQWRDLGVRDALARSEVEDFHSNRGELDFETLLEVDPDVLLLRGQEAKTAEEFNDTVVSFMADNDVASSLTAVANGDVYRGGPLYQGPITNLVLTERAAGQVYGVEGELFDRERVAEIVTGQ